MFANNYTDTIPAGTNLTAFCEALLPHVATAAGVPEDRITDMMVAEQPETGEKANQDIIFTNLASFRLCLCISCLTKCELIPIRQ
jgi:hypothetical protein